MARRAPMVRYACQHPNRSEVKAKVDLDLEAAKKVRMLAADGQTAHAGKGMQDMAGLGASPLRSSAQLTDRSQSADEKQINIKVLEAL